MDKELEHTIDKMIKKMEGMTKEEFAKKILQLNGTMNEELFNKVIDELFDKGSLDWETIVYDLKKFNITEKEFQYVFDYLDVYSEDYQKQSATSMFPETFCYFNCKAGFFMWRLVIGQGSFCQLTTDIPSDIKISFVEHAKVNTELKFYKRLEDES